MHTAPSTPAWPWPDSLDAVIAGPAHHRVLLENDEVWVLDTRIEPGDTVQLHTHRWPAVLHVLGVSDWVRRDEHGQVIVDTRAQNLAAPSVAWSPALPPHTLENVGNALIHVLSIEIKQDARQATGHQ